MVARITNLVSSVHSIWTVPHEGCVFYFGRRESSVQPLLVQLRSARFNSKLFVRGKVFSIFGKSLAVRFVSVCLDCLNSVSRDRIQRHVC